MRLQKGWVDFSGVCLKDWSRMRPKITRYIIHIPLLLFTSAQIIPWSKLSPSLPTVSLSGRCQTRDLLSRWLPLNFSVNHGQHLLPQEVMMATYFLCYYLIPPLFHQHVPLTSRFNAARPDVSFPQKASHAGLPDGEIRL